MDWLAKIPNLYPTESLWGVPTSRSYLNRRQFDTFTALKTCVVEKGANINQSVCYRLIRSMTDTYAAVPERQGTKYVLLEPE